MQSLISCSDIIKFWVPQIKVEWIRQGAFCRLFFAKEQRKALKAWEELVGWLFHCTLDGAARDVPTTRFCDHLIVW